MLTKFKIIRNLRRRLRFKKFHASQLRMLSSKQCSEDKKYDEPIYLGSSGIPDILEKWNTTKFLCFGLIGSGACSAAYYSFGITIPVIVGYCSMGAYWVMGIRDISQTSHTIRRNFPVLGNLRYLLESMRPEIRQYFIEADNEAVPFSRSQRSIVYQRAKGMSDTLPFGTRDDVYKEGYEWVNHSMWPKTIQDKYKRVEIGNKDCKQPYVASRLNISAMSYGALSSNAILALNKGASIGQFYHNTGEGGVSSFHLKPGGDIVWNIGTGYFGCRDIKTGGFCPDKFKEQASVEQLKMIEIKLSQGAKPAHGGLLPASKITEEIALARGIPMGFDCDSPAAHKAFNGPRSLIQFISTLRELSGGKPIGFKLCLGRPKEFAAVVGAMIEMDVYPDFITVDGTEGGTGAAPPEFSNSIGFPLTDALNYVNNVLVGANVRQHITIIASGKVTTGFSIVRNMALGADVCNSARGMMFSLGCIQALKCNTNKCPTGIATQNATLVKGLDPTDKSFRVRNFQEKTLENCFEIMGAIGLDNPSDLHPGHIMRRMSGGDKARSYRDIYPPLDTGSLLEDNAHHHPSNVQHMWNQSQLLLKNKESDLTSYST